MLKFLRQYSRSWVIAVAIGAIVVVFIFWGIGGFRSPRFEEAATVNGVPILMSRYLQQYNQLLRQYQEMGRGELKEEDLKALGLKDRALEILIQEELLRQGARQLGIVVTDEELREHIKGLDIFHEDGRFSQRRYLAALSRARISPADFEEQERLRLLSQRLIQMLTAFAKVSEAELNEILRLGKEEVEVRYLALTPERFVPQQKPTEEEIAAYYRDHAQEFRTPERVKVRYVVFQPQAFLAQATVSDRELADYLAEHAVEFTLPQVIKVREIFLAAPPQPDKRRQVEQKAQGLLRQAKGGGDFASLARSHSEDAAARAKGGELPPVKRGQRDPAWEKVAFALAPGQVGLAQTAKGFYLLKLEEVLETEKLPEAQAREQAVARLRQEKSRTLAQEAARQARLDLLAGDFAEVSKKLKLTVKETPLFALGDALPGEELTRAFKETALALKPQEVSRVVETPAGLVVMQALEKRPAAVPPLEEVREQVRQAVARQKAKDQAGKEAEQLLARLRQGEPLAKVAAQAGVPLQESGPFTRPQGFLRQPLAESLTTAAFLLSEKNPYPDKPFFFRDAYYILAFKTRRLPPAEELKQEEEKLKEQLLETKRQVLFDAWLTQERRRAVIKVRELPV